jgi:poly(A) polymerase
MSVPQPSLGFRLLDKTGLLPLLLQEVSAMKGVEEKEGKGHKDNFHHSLKVLDNLSAKSDNLWLRWAALLHDIGKPLPKILRGTRLDFPRT